jgi:hypothetical protein
LRAPCFAPARDPARPPRACVPARDPPVPLARASLRATPPVPLARASLARRRSPSRSGVALPCLPGTVRGPVPAPGPSGVAPWRPCARPRPPARPLSGARPLAPGSTAPRGLPSAFPRVQPQRVRRSNFSLIGFEFSLMNVLRRALCRATNEFKFRFISVVSRTLRRAAN